MAKKRIAESDAESDGNIVSCTRFNTSQLSLLILNHQPKRPRVDNLPASKKSEAKSKKTTQRTKSSTPASSGDENGSGNGRGNRPQATQRKSMVAQNDEEFEKANAERVKRSMTQKHAQTGVGPLLYRKWNFSLTIALFRQQKRGLSAAWNFTISCATGK